MKLATLLIPNTILTTTASSSFMYIYTPAGWIAGVDANMPHGMLNENMHLGYDKDIIKKAKSIG
jgi:hypothetical protein